jgi:glycosyltransferase involved in cell wall biosynthesis
MSIQSAQFKGNNYVPVTVVVPCFRCKETIQRAVKSVWKQTRRPSEVILIDDASGDGTLAALHSLSVEYPNWIKIITFEKNKGCASARNAGWNAATEEYIAFLDADDSWHPEKLAVQYDIMRMNPDIALTGHPYQVFLPGQVLPLVDLSLCVAKRTGSINLCLRNRFSTPTVMLKKNLPFRFKEGKRFSEDYDLWLQIVFSGFPAYTINGRMTYLHKAPYGESGLSANLWAMEKGELDSFLSLYHTKKILLPMLCLLGSFSLAKYAMRLLIVFIRYVSLRLV